MKTNTNRNLIRTLLLAVMMVCAMTVAVPSMIFAANAVIEPSNETNGRRDAYNIKLAVQNEENDTVTLQSGQTYYLAYSIPLRSGITIDATGATIVVMKGICHNAPATAKKYGAVKNVTIKGGTWKSATSSGVGTSAIKLCNADKVTIQDMNIRVCTYDDHSLELVGCRNITVKNCDLSGVGKINPNNVEEQVQIDICSKRTAPYLPSLPDYKEGVKFSTSYWNGAACENITLLNCKVYGNRAVCANYSKQAGNKYRKNFHKNIVIKNCTLTGQNAEALALFNTMSATVYKNTIISKSSKTSASESVGCQIAMFYKAPAAIKKSTIKLDKNTIKGGRQAVNVVSKVSGSKYGKIVITNNKLYCKTGKNNALYINKDKSAIKYSESKNKKYKWK